MGYIILCANTDDDTHTWKTKGKHKATVFEDILKASAEVDALNALCATLAIDAITYTVGVAP